MIRRRPRAIYAIIEQAEYIGQDSPDAAERFMDATEETFRDLDEMPGMGHPHESPNPRLAGVRVWPVKGFRNHLIFYRPSDGGVEILTILHGARDIERALEDEV